MGGLTAAFASLTVWAVGDSAMHSQGMKCDAWLLKHALLCKIYIIGRQCQVVKQKSMKAGVSCDG